MLDVLCVCVCACVRACMCVCEHIIKQFSHTYHNHYVLLQLIHDYDKLGIQVLLAAPARKLYMAL